jgi:hypothetical protein
MTQNQSIYPYRCMSDCSASFFDLKKVMKLYNISHVDQTRCQNKCERRNHLVLMVINHDERQVFKHFFISLRCKALKSSVK